MDTSSSVPRIPALDLSALSWWVGSDLVMSLALLDSSPLSTPFAGMVAGAPVWWTQTLASIQDESVLHQLCRLGNPQRFLGGIVASQWSQLTGVELGPEVRVAKCVFDGEEWGTTQDFAKEVIRTYAWKVLTTPPAHQPIYLCFVFQLFLFLASVAVFVWRWLALKETDAGIGADIQALSVLIITVTNSIGSVITWYRWKNFRAFLDENTKPPVDHNAPNQTGIWSGYTDLHMPPVIVVGIQDHLGLSRALPFKSDRIATYFCIVGLLVNAIFGLSFGIGGVLSQDGSLALIYVAHGILQAVIIMVTWRQLDSSIVSIPVDQRVKARSAAESETSRSKKQVRTTSVELV